LNASLAASQRTILELKLQDLYRRRDHELRNSGGLVDAITPSICIELLQRSRPARRFRT
jgi:hypothetical protein